MAFSPATGLSRHADVPWPKGLAPKTGRAPCRGSNSPLSRADVLVVTWTIYEGHALSRVLTPGKDSHNDYLSYCCLADCRLCGQRTRGSRARYAGKPRMTLRFRYRTLQLRALCWVLRRLRAGQVGYAGVIRLKRC
jgi:hypothetical protein